MDYFKEKPVTDLNEIKSHECNCKLLTGLRMDLNQLIVLMSEIHKKISGNGGGIS